LASAAQAALAAAYESDGDSAHDLLARAHTALRNAGETDPQLASAGTLLAEAMINTREAAEALRRYLDVLDIDPARQEEIERHAAALEALARKHRISVLELPAQLTRTAKELAELDRAQQNWTALRTRGSHQTPHCRKALGRCENAAAHLSRGNHETHAFTRHGGRPVRGLHRNQ
jgi:DNA repair ATPase RecN